MQLALQFAASLEPRLLKLVERDELDAEAEITAPGRWGTTFTLIQARRRG